MHHWVSAGHLNPSKLLVRRVPDKASGSEAEFALVGTLFADPATAFVPDGMDAEAWGELARSLAGKASTAAAAEAARSGSSSSAKRASESKAVAPSGSIAPAAFSKAEIARVAPAMLRYFANGASWYYHDSEGEQHGPFSGKKMGEWFQAGFLWQTQLQVGHEGWDSFSALEDLVAAATGEAAASGASGGSSSDGAGGQSDVGAGHEERSGGGSSTAVAAAPAPAAEAQTGSEAVSLEYIDDDGVVQGPFDHAVVARWVVDGMFPLELLMRVAGQPSSEWRPAGELAELADAVAAHEAAAAAAAAAGEDDATEGAAAAADGDPGGDGGLRVDDVEDDPAAGAADAVQPVPAVSPSSMVEYIDDAGEVQGPFEASLVQSWLEAGYFEHSAKARLGGTTAWVAMSELFTF